MSDWYGTQEEAIMAIPDEDDDGEVFVVVCRAIPGDHPGGRGCWCDPYVVEASDDVAVAKLLELSRHPEQQVT
jgi:hypothetical protein